MNGSYTITLTGLFMLKKYLCYISKEVACFAKKQDLIESQLQVELKYYNTEAPQCFPGIY